MPRHTHERAYFCLTRTGTYAEQYGRRTRVCTPGTVVFHPPGEAHSEMHAVTVLTLNVEIGGSWLTNAFEVGCPLDRPVEFRDNGPVARAWDLYREFTGTGTDSDVAIESLVWEILTSSLTVAQRSERAPAWLRDARDLIEARFGHPVSLRLLAEDAGMHPVYFAAAFRKFFGCSVGEYVRRRRLQRAREKLTDSDAPLAQIALEVGFADQSHFVRTFKRFTGLTPGQYRTFLTFKTSR